MSNYIKRWVKKKGYTYQDESSDNFEGFIKFIFLLFLFPIYFPIVVGGVAIYSFFITIKAIFDLMLKN